jgi:hypothetical protein
MQDAFFSWRQEIPSYFLQYNDGMGHTLPGWAQTAYARARYTSTETWYSDVLTPITISDLRFCLKDCKNNKSGGPSGLTYEMIKAHPDDVLICHFIPLLNNILLTGSDPSLFGFIPKGRVDDALLAYLFILEDVHQHKKPFHMGVNDFSKAYDSVPHWALGVGYTISSTLVKSRVISEYEVCLVLVYWKKDYI